MDGIVGAFDEAKGYGTVQSPDGRQFFFHCTQIVDGTRRIGVGTSVEFQLVAGHRGRYEATQLRMVNCP